MHETNLTGVLTMNPTYAIEFAPKIYEQFLDYRDSRVYCEMITIDDKEDWHLPTLQQLAYYNFMAANFEWSSYWVWDNNLVDDRRLCFNFSDQDATLVNRFQNAYCRPVRELVIDPDLVNKIEWLELDIDRLKWDDARLYCFSLNIDGKVGWRLPTIEELDSLHHTGKIKSELTYWSSKTYEDEAVIKSFDFGLRSFTMLDNYLHIIAVRDL